MEVEHWNENWGVLNEQNMKKKLENAIEAMIYMKENKLILYLQKNQFMDIYQLKEVF